jgi:NTP pyrophosphatase (non-canonical NTP hydrolase)
MNNSETQILLIAQEECAEVIQAISKVFRFGIDREHNGQTNYERLTEEVGDLICMINLMVEKGIIEETKLNIAATQKRFKLEKWSKVFENEESVTN